MKESGTITWTCNDCKKTHQVERAWMRKWGKGKGKKGSRKGNCRMRETDCRWLPRPESESGRETAVAAENICSIERQIKSFYSLARKSRSLAPFIPFCVRRARGPALSPLSHFDDFSAELEENIAAEVAETASQEGLNRRRRRPATLSSPSGGAAVGEVFQSGK